MILTNTKIPKRLGFIYSLSDFKTADGIRKGEDYMNNYFVSRYGAIKDVDFSQILENVISGSEVTADG